MGYRVELTREAEAHLDRPDIRRARMRILQEVRTQLTYEPLVETRNRFAMEPNSIASHELRVQPFRVFYEVEEETRTVRLLAIGVKIRDAVYIGGSRVDLHG